MLHQNNIFGGSENPIRILIPMHMGIGNMVLFIPLIVAVRRAYPNAHISGIFTGSNGSDALVRGLKENLINELIYTRGDNRIMFRLKGLYRVICTRWDLIILRFNSFSLELLIVSYLTRGLVVGHVTTYSKRRLLETKIDISVFCDLHKPEQLRYYALVKRMGIEEFWDNYSFTTLLNNRKFVDTLRNSEEKVISLIPGSSQLQTWKRWPIASWDELIHLLLKNNYEIQILGGKDDEVFVGWLDESFGGKRVVNYIGKTSLFESIELLRDSNIVVSNDTGLMHFAVSLKKPTIGLFGPTNERMCGYENYANFHPIRALECTGNCYEIGRELNCNVVQQCMQNIKVEDVFNLICKLDE